MRHHQNSHLNSAFVAESLTVDVFTEDEVIHSWVSSHLSGLFSYRQ